MKIRLIVNLYEIKSQQRLKEIASCLEKNIANKHIDEIFVLDEGFQHNKLLSHPKVVRIQVSERVMFSDFYNYFDECHINIFANNDIWFDRSLIWLKYMKLRQTDFLTLTRRERDLTLFRQENGDTQDAWIIKGRPECIKECDFYLGIFGCDNRLLFVFFQQGYRVLNPSKTINAMHEHCSNIRSYAAESRVKGYYLSSCPINFIEFHVFRLFLKIMQRKKIHTISRANL